MSSTAGRNGRNWSWRRVLFYGLLLSVTATALWTWWAEDHPREERRLRTLVHDHLEEWFPDQMDPDDGWYGIHPRASPADARCPPVLLVHGLDEPGNIWDDLAPALDEAGFPVWELRYPNDQGIDRSADFLARHWSELPTGQPVVLIGHSMGGLVIRDFVSRLKYPVGADAQVNGTDIAAVILVGTPSQGSEWARLRVWLELRDQFQTISERRFSLFAALRDGTGEAKIDLRPGSDFLRALNARPWPPGVPVLDIAGRLLDAPEDIEKGLDEIASETGSTDLDHRLSAWWSGLGEELGDGVVSLESARIPGGAERVVLNASHRGMISRLLPGDPRPPAIPVILTALEGWAAGSSPACGPFPGNTHDMSPARSGHR